jgi:hypothetical protein
LPFRNALNVRLFELVLIAQPCDRSAIPAAVGSLHTLRSLSPRRIDYTSDRIEVEMDVSGGPSDEAFIIVDLKVPPVPC